MNPVKVNCTSGAPPATGPLTILDPTTLQKGALKPGRYTTTYQDLSDPTETPLSVVPRLNATKRATLAVDADQNGAPSPGDTLRYDVELTNPTSAPASELTFKSKIDSNLQLVTGSVTAATGATVITGNSPADTQVALTLSELSPLASATASYQAKIPTEIDPSVKIVSSFGLAGALGFPDTQTDDPDQSGTQDETTTELVHTSESPPKLTASKRDLLAVDLNGNGKADPGDTVSYEVTVANTGTGTATNTTFTDTPGENSKLVAGSVAVPGGLTVTEGNGATDAKVTVAFGSFNPGSWATFSFQVKIDNPMPAGVNFIRNQGVVETTELAPVLTKDPAPTTPDAATFTPVTLPPAVPPAVGEVTPVDGAVITQPTDVIAQVTPPTGQTIASVCLYHDQLATSTPPVKVSCTTGPPGPDNKVATFDPTTLQNGTYDLTIKATTSSGGSSSTTATVSVEGNLKPGRYTTTYQDLSVPVHSLPIQLQRTYDSYDKLPGDFGVGWNATVANFSVTTNGPLGTGGWSHRPSGCITTVLGTPSSTVSPNFTARTNPI